MLRWGLSGEPTTHLLSLKWSLLSWTDWSKGLDDCQEDASICLELLTTEWPWPKHVFKIPFSMEVLPDMRLTVRVWGWGMCVPLCWYLLRLSLLLSSQDGVLTMPQQHKMCNIDWFQFSPFWQPISSATPNKEDHSPRFCCTHHSQIKCPPFTQAFRQTIVSRISLNEYSLGTTSNTG